MMYQINSISHNKSPAICLQNFHSELSTRSFSNEILGADFCAPKESFDAELPLKKKSSVLRIKICFSNPTWQNLPTRQRKNSSVENF